MTIDPEKKSFYLRGSDGKAIYVHQWLNVKEPRGVVQIFHGMAEHAGRYERFAQFLNSNGYYVFGDDHRGHGLTAVSHKELGYIGEDGFNRIIEDEHLLTRLIKDNLPGLPIFVFSHSFGSFIGQSYITKYGADIKGIILSGSAARNRREIKLGRLLSTADSNITGEEGRSLLLNALCFGTYNKKIHNHASKFSWLTRDESEVKKFEEDEFCGTVCTVNFFYYLFNGLTDLYRRGNFRRVPSRLPIYIMSGTEDPVGSYTEDVKRLYRLYRDAKVKDLTIMLYPGCRHELLNEINRYEVYNNVLQWLNSHA